MKIFDKIYDSDAYIEGVILDKKDDVFFVLWDNLVYGKVKENFENISVKEHLNLGKYLVVDILHTGHHGKEFESKVGKKYEVRKNRILILNLDDLEKDHGLVLNLFGNLETNKETNPEPVNVFQVYTTPFEELYEKDNFVYLRTLNSIYKLKKL